MERLRKGCKALYTDSLNENRSNTSSSIPTFGMLPIHIYIYIHNVSLKNVYIYILG
jgi:hypothetical protein